MLQILIPTLLVTLITGCSPLGGFVKATNPEEKFIEIVGSIDKGLKYKIKVSYLTTAKLSNCTNYHYKLGRDVAQKYEVSYYPKINGTSHTLRVPLRYLEPNTECQWRPVMAHVCVYSYGEEPNGCSSVFSFRGEQNIDSVTTLVCGKHNICFRRNKRTIPKINELNRSYRLDIISKKT